MKWSTLIGFLGAGVASAMIALAAGFGNQPAPMDQPAPEFTGIQEWINSKPLTLQALRGRVVALHFWTFG